MTTFEVDYFTEVIIDELKKEIRELKNTAEARDKAIQSNRKNEESTENEGVNRATILRSQQHMTIVEESLKGKDDMLMQKIKTMKHDMEILKEKASKSQNENLTDSDMEKLKMEVDNLKRQLSQGQ